MGFNVSWDPDGDDRFILYYAATGHWTWEEFYTALDRARRLADSVDQPVIDSIIDLRDGSLLPQGALAHFRRLPARSHPKLAQGIVVIIHESLIIRSLMDVLRRLYPQVMTHFRNTDSPEVAHILLFQARRRTAVIKGFSYSPR